MIRRVALPSEGEVREVLAKLAEVTEGGRPTVIACAGALGLANATFWRHFPGIAQEIADNRRLRGPVESANLETKPVASAATKAELAQLRTDKSKLREQLETAVANIQRLTLENRELRRELEKALNVTRLPRQ